MCDETFYDIIGDIHGRIDKLKLLMDRLGYEPDDKGFRPPKGHKALFLGDLIDPKPGHSIEGGVKAVLEAVKAMCDAGNGECIMGNHELNIIHFHSKCCDGEWLRVRGEKNYKMHKGTLEDFPDHDDPESEWQTVWLPWLKGLPFHFEHRGFRAIHATWHPEMIERVASRDFSCSEFLSATAKRTSPEYEAMEILLKGIEVSLPEGEFFEDHTGTERTMFRARWWELPGTEIHCSELVFPENPDIPPVPVDKKAFEEIPGYGLDEKPMFFGHYFKPGHEKPTEERLNVACLDYSAAKEGPLVAYRWKGETSIKPEHYVTSYGL